MALSSRASVSASTIDPRAQNVLIQSSRPLNAIRTIEFRAESVGTVNQPGGGKGQLSCAYFFHSNGNLYRDDEFDPNGRPSDSYSFNGTIYQFFSNEFSAFRESNQWMGTRNQTSFLDPISEAYSWVYPTNARRTWETLRSRESWDDVVNRSIYIGEKSVDGRKVVTLEVQRRGESGQDFVFTVDFDKDHSCVPIAKTTYLLPSRKLTGTTRVNRFADVDAGDAGRIRVPIDVSLKWAVGDVTHRMVEATLQINQPIDADVFTIPRSRANNIWSEPKVRRRARERLTSQRGTCR